MMKSKINFAQEVQNRFWFHSYSMSISFISFAVKRVVVVVGKVHLNSCGN